LPATLSIFGLNGTLISKTAVPAGQQQFSINTANLSPGTYRLLLESRDQRWQQTLIRQ